MNAVSLSGHLTEDPELIYRSDRAICELRLAVDNPRHKTTFIDVRTFDEQAYACAEYLTKGRQIAVSGRLTYDEWRADDDSKRERYSVIGWVEFLDRQSHKQDAQPEEHEPQLVAG